MTPFLTDAFPRSLVPAGINHLLAQESWARDKLLAHVGKVACIDVELITMRWKVTADGMVESAAVDAAASVTIRVKLAELPLMAQNRARAFSYVKVDGDADFANAISQLSQSLRWEAEADLSKWIGDIAAVRLVSGAKAVLGAAQSTHQKLAENLAEFFLDEQPMLVRPQAVADFASEVAKMRDDVERLAKRLQKLDNTT